MTDTLDYDADEARQETAIHRTPAVDERRAFVRDRLDPAPGATVLSVGCGPGFEPAGLADETPADRVVGVDRSPAMLALARDRCADRPQVTLSRADATRLPVADGAVDAAVAVQVYEYVDDLAGALAELRRALRPGGRAVVYDTDFGTLVWRADDGERAARVLDAFDDHCPRPRLGSTLAPRVRDAGLAVARVDPYTIVNTDLGGTFAGRLADFVADYAADHPDVPDGEAAAWLDDLRARDDAGATFFSLTQYCYVVERPA